MEDEMMDKILRIVQLSILLNPDERNQELTGDEPTAMLMFFGVSQSVQVSVYENGWGQKENSKVFYMWNGQEKGEETLNACITCLENLCEKCGIPTNEHYMKVTANG